MEIVWEEKKVMKKIEGKGIEIGQEKARKWDSLKVRQRDLDNLQNNLIHIHKHDCDKFVHNNLLHHNHIQLC